MAEKVVAHRIIQGFCSALFLDLLVMGMIAFVFLVRSPGVLACGSLQQFLKVLIYSRRGLYIYTLNWSTDIRTATWYITTVNRILTLFNVQQIHVNIDIHI